MIKQRWNSVLRWSLFPNARRVNCLFDFVLQNFRWTSLLKNRVSLNIQIDCETVMIPSSSFYNFDRMTRNRGKGIKWGLGLKHLITKFLGTWLWSNGFWNVIITKLPQDISHQKPTTKIRLDKTASSNTFQRSTSNWLRMSLIYQTVWVKLHFQKMNPLFRENLGI